MWIVWPYIIRNTHFTNNCKVCFNEYIFIILIPKVSTCPWPEDTLPSFEGSASCWGLELWYSKNDCHVGYQGEQTRIHHNFHSVSANSGLRWSWSWFWIPSKSRKSPRRQTKICSPLSGKYFPITLFNQRYVGTAAVVRFYFHYVYRSTLYWKSL